MVATPDIIECSGNVTGNTYCIPRGQFIRRPSVYGILFWQSQLLMIRGSQNKKLWFPGGGIEHGETFEQALARELLQEANLRLLECRYWRLFTNWIYDETQDRALEVYLYFFFAEADGWSALQSNDPNEGHPELIDHRRIDPGELQNIAPLIIGALPPHAGLQP